VLQLKDLRGRCDGEDEPGWRGLGSEGNQRGEILRLAMLGQDEHASPHAQLEGPREGRVPARPGCPATASGMQKAHKKRTWFGGHFLRWAAEGGCQIYETIIAYW